MAWFQPLLFHRFLREKRGFLLAGDAIYGNESMYRRPEAYLAIALMEKPVALRKRLEVAVS
jgi:hypothetical protein